MRARLPRARTVCERDHAGCVRRADGLPFGVRRSRYLRLCRCRLLRPFLPLRRRRKGVVQGHAAVSDCDAVLRGARLRRLVYGQLLRRMRAADRVRALSRPASARQVTPGRHHCRMLSLRPMNSFSRRIVVGSVLAVAAGCGGHPLQLSGDGGSGGQGRHVAFDASPDVTPCRGLDEAACTATPGCTAGTCPSCYGNTTFQYCYHAGVDAPPTCTTTPPCAVPECNGLDEASCKGTSGCQAQSCQVCSGAAPTYAGCTTPGALLACPA